MKVERYPLDTGWYAEVVLDKNEWPPLDAAGEWMDRPIRKWVYDHCYPRMFFSHIGLVLFRSKKDLMMFQLTWG